MATIWWFVIGMIIGSFAGLGLAALLVTAREGDDCARCTATRERLSWLADGGGAHAGPCSAEDWAGVRDGQCDCPSCWSDSTKPEPEGVLTVGRTDVGSRIDKLIVLLDRNGELGKQEDTHGDN